MTSAPTMIRHGAKNPTCSHEGCTNYAIRGGVCTRHGAKVSRETCNHKGCTNIAGQVSVIDTVGASQSAAVMKVAPTMPRREEMRIICYSGLKIVRPERKKVRR